jgi:hypothetical protein
MNLRLEETAAAILSLSKGGAAIKMIVRLTYHSWRLVRHVLRVLHGDYLPLHVPSATIKPSVCWVTIRRR